MTLSIEPAGMTDCATDLLSFFEISNTGYPIWYDLLQQAFPAIIARLSNTFVSFFTASPGILSDEASPSLRYCIYVSFVIVD
jgi:hypothetical protein